MNLVLKLLPMGLEGPLHSLDIHRTLEGFLEDEFTPFLNGTLTSLGYF